MGWKDPENSTQTDLSWKGEYLTHKVCKRQTGVLSVHRLQLVTTVAISSLDIIIIL